jgi:surface antigen
MHMPRLGLFGVLALLIGFGLIVSPAATAAVVNPKPLTAAPAPAISGTAKAGSLLTSVPGIWGPSPVGLSYQWKRGGAAITGARAATYKLTNADAGTTVTVAVTGTKVGYVTTTRTSKPTTLVTGGVLTAPTPTISGLKVVGQKLAAAPGVWGPAPVTIRYQWKRGGLSIVGATTASYTLTPADLNRVISVTVTGSKTGFTTQARTSAATAAVANPKPLTAAPVPAISGSARAGSVLTALPGAWGPSPVTLSYQWKRGGALITGARAATYKLTNADAGTTVTVAVTGTKTGYVTTTRTSKLTTLVTGGVLTAPTPSISGTAKAGRPLTAAAGTWGPAPVTLQYAWKQDGVTITGAASSSYTPTSSDVGKTITVTVTGTKGGYTTVSKASSPTAAVAPAVTDRVSAAGVLLVGESLKSSSGEYRLVLQADGNLVETFQNRAVWASGTDRSGATMLAMQADGNLVLYAGAKPVWSSGTPGTLANVLILQNDGNAVVYGPDKPYWASSTRVDGLNRAQTLTAGQYLKSLSGAYRFVVQGDGNAVVYQGSTVIWATNTVGATNPTFIVQQDGNAVLYGPSGAAWASNTTGTPADHLVMQDDGNLVLYGGGRALWSSKGGAGSGTLVDDYPSNWRSAAQDSLVDSWGYYNRECTSWTAWRLHTRNGFEMPRAIGNASNWGIWAAAHGYAVDGTPRPGAVAWSGPGNHVAWVAAVGNGTVTLEEYNYGFTGTYHTRTLATGSYKYIHFKD